MNWQMRKVEHLKHKIFEREREDIKFETEWTLTTENTFSSFEFSRCVFVFWTCSLNFETLETLENPEQSPRLKADSTNLATQRILKRIGIIKKDGYPWFDVMTLKTPTFTQDCCFNIFVQGLVWFDQGSEWWRSGDPRSQHDTVLTVTRDAPVPILRRRFSFEMPRRCLSWWDIAKRSATYNHSCWFTDKVITASLWKSGVITFLPVDYW